MWFHSDKCDDCYFICLINVPFDHDFPWKFSQRREKFKKKNPKQKPIAPLSKCRLLRKLFFHCIISALVKSRVCSLYTRQIWGNADGLSSWWGSDDLPVRFGSEPWPCRTPQNLTRHGINHSAASRLYCERVTGNEGVGQNAGSWTGTRAFVEGFYKWRRWVTAWNLPDIRNVGSWNWTCPRTSPALAAGTDVLLTEVCNSGQTYTSLLKLLVDFLPRRMISASASAYLKFVDNLYLFKQELDPLRLRTSSQPQ